MEGPTPVSALIHAATMVTAGVYMVARSNALFVLAPNAMKTVAIVGALTAIFAASIGLVQNDIKRVLAYSTVSQLGYMFLALGVGAFCRRRLPRLHARVLQGAALPRRRLGDSRHERRAGHAQHGRPARKDPDHVRHHADRDAGDRGHSRPFAGFFSKDEILWQTWSREGGAYRYLWFIGYVTALMTSFYMFRLIYLTFFGKPRMSHEVEHHIHESPKSMTVPLVILAVCSLFAGFLGLAAQFGRLGSLCAVPGAGVRRSEAVVCMRKGKPRQLAAGEREEEHTSPMEYVLMFLSVGSGGGWLVLASAPTRNADKGYIEPIEASRRRSTRRCSTSITWTKSTTRSSPGAAKWAACVWA